MNSNESTKAKNADKTAILETLRKSIIIDEVPDSEGLEDLSKNVDCSDDAVKLVRKIENILKSKKNNILILTYHQGLIFKKIKKYIKFTRAVSNLKISKPTINFKIGIIQFLHDYPKTRKSSISLHFLKNNFRVIKEVCREHSSDFQ